MRPLDSKNRRLRAVHVTGSLSRLGGGVPPVVWSLAKAQAGTGLAVQVIGLEDNFTAEDVARLPSLPWHAVKTFGPRILGYSPDLKRHLLSTGNVDVVHVHGLWQYYGLAVRQVARRTSTKLIIAPHGMLDPWALEVSTWKKRLASLLCERKNLESAACIHALCESEYRSIRAYGLNNPVAVIPNGIYLPTCDGRLAPPWAGAVPLDKRVLLFLGRIDYKKNIHGLIEAWHRLKSKGVLDGWILAIAGWSRDNAKRYEDQVRQKAADMNLGGSVLFTGPLYDEMKKAAFQNADCFILPSYSEGLPMAVLEAWAYGLPVIVTAECNIPEGFQAGAAIEIRTEIESIKRGLEYFLSLSNAEQKNIGLKGRNLVETRFAWPKIGAQMIDVYKWVLGKADEPNCVRIG